MKIEDIRKNLQSMLSKDSSYHDPNKRIPWQQSNVWPFIKQHMKDIMSDRGDDDRGSYPAAPYAAWLLVQHMDAFYDTHQKEFLNSLKANNLDPTSGKPNSKGKLKFLQDRYSVNKKLVEIFNNPKNKKDGKSIFLDKNGNPLTDPIQDVRNPAKFDDAALRATSAKQALENAKKHNNELLVAAVLAANATGTQPSFASD